MPYPLRLQFTTNTIRSFTVNKSHIGLVFRKRDFSVLAHIDIPLNKMHTDLAVKEIFRYRHTNILLLLNKIPYPLKYPFKNDGRGWGKVNKIKITHPKKIKTSKQYSQYLNFILKHISCLKSKDLANHWTDMALL